jgi:GNAT superfamily N-acetyltransferase
MIAVRRAETEADLELWTRIRNLVEPDEPTTLQDLRDGQRRSPETRYWLAHDRGEAVGCCFAAFSAVPGRVFVLPRVVAAARGRGAGTALLEAGLAYARELGGGRARTSVDGRDETSLGFAARRGFEEVDRQVELVRPLAADEDPSVELPAGVGLEEVPAARVAELRELVAEGVADMSVAGGLGDGVVDELLDEFDGALFRIAAVENATPVGVAGLLRYGAREDALEHAFTTVLRSHRGRGIAHALKATCVRWAAANGYRELVTWTQTGNDAMQAVNIGVGFRTGQVSITLEAALA